MSTTTLLTLEQYEQLPEEDGVRYELKDGDLIKKMGNANYGHERTKFKILRLLIPYIVQHPIGEVYSETAFAVSPSRVCRPDVSFLRNELAAQADRDHMLRVAPDLAIEVVSESQPATELRQKIQEYLAPARELSGRFIPACVRLPSMTRQA